MRINKVFRLDSWQCFRSNIQVSLLQDKVFNRLVCDGGLGTISTWQKVDSTNLVTLGFAIFSSTNEQVHGHRAQGNVLFTTFSWTDAYTVIFLSQGPQFSAAKRQRFHGSTFFTVAADGNIKVCESSFLSFSRHHFWVLRVISPGNIVRDGNVLSFTFLIPFITFFTEVTHHCLCHNRQRVFPTFAAGIH